jgi:hypothetical protein
MKFIELSRDEARDLGLALIELADADRSSRLRPVWSRRAVQVVMGAKISPPDSRYTTLIRSNSASTLRSASVGAPAGEAAQISTQRHDPPFDVSVVRADRGRIADRRVLIRAAAGSETPRTSPHRRGRYS